MAEYTMKPIDNELVNRLKTALENYKSRLTVSNCFSDISECHHELSNTFSAVVDARSKAIDESFPTFEIDRMKGNPDYEIIIRLDKTLEDLLNEVCQILGEKHHWSK